MKLLKRRGAGLVQWWWGRLEELAPFLAIVAMMFLPWWLPTAVAFPDELLARNARIAEAFANAPWIINERWSGQAVPVPVAATRILRPTAIVSRQFRAISGSSELEGHDGTEVIFSVTHCTEMRDMQGHYPPVCYPSQGWLMGDDPPHMLHLSSKVLGDFSLIRYEFGIAISAEEYLERTVLNFFIMPGGEITPNMDRMNRLKNRRSTSMLGVAQIQMVIDERLDDETCVHILQDLVDGMPNLFEQLRGSPLESDDVDA